MIAPFVQAAIRRATLDNGLAVLILPVHAAPLASVWCWYRVGSADEAAGQTGASHWVEHMNFKGTRNIPRDQVKGIIERYGGTWNGYTWIDQTTYLEPASRVALDQMLFIESERMASSLFDPGDCESERTVIISELQGGENDPDQVLDIEVTAAAFKAHPYGHPTIGWIDDVRRMTRDDLYGHYRRYYVPNNAALVVVGDVDADEALRAVDRRFGVIAPASLPPRTRTSEPEQAGERRVVVAREGTTAYVKIAYHAPPAGDPAFASLLILDAVLTGANGVNLWHSFRTPPPQRHARLYRALVEQRLAASVGGALLPTLEPFLYTISVTVGDGAAPASVEAAALEAISRVSAEGVSEAELRRAKGQLRARLVFEAEGVTNLAHQIGYFEALGSVESYFELLAQMEAATGAQVNEVARRVLSSRNRTVGRFEPVVPGTPGQSPAGAGTGASAGSAPWTPQARLADAAAARTGQAARGAGGAWR